MPDETPSAAVGSEPPGIGWLLALLMLALLPLAADYLLVHPDERHYTDGAGNMLVDGQWLSPRTAEGEYRFKKPVLAYWATAAGIRAFGGNALGARILFLLAAAGTVYVTYRTALIIHRRGEWAFMTAAIVAMNPEIILAGTRSMPDILLMFFLCVTFWGFTGVILRPRREWIWPWVAHLGVGLALATKGSPPLAMALYFAVCAWALRGSSALRRTLYPGALATGLIIGLAWYVAALAMHGRAMWAEFMEDHGPGRVAGDSMAVAAVFLFYAALWPALSVPWSPVAVVAILRRQWSRRRLPRRARLGTLLAIGWVVVTTIILSLLTNVYDRYTLIAMPAVCIAIVGLFRKMRPANLTVELKRVSWIVLSLLAMGGLLVFGVNTWLRCWDGMMKAAVAGGVMGLLVYRIVRYGQPWSHVTAVAVAWLGFVGIAGLGLGWLVVPEAGQQLAEAMRAHRLLRGQDSHQTVVMVGEDNIAAMIRVFTSYQAELDGYSWLVEPGAAEAAANASWLIIHEDEFADLEQGLFEPVITAYCIRDTSPSQLWHAVRSGELNELRQSLRKRLFLARRVDQGRVGGPIHHGETVASFVRR